MTLEFKSPCKVNLILNILGKREDGFHELETLMHPVPLFDLLTFEEQSAKGVKLTCSDASLPVDSSNLVLKAARLFAETAGVEPSLRIHLEKKVPMCAGLGGGSANAAVTLLALNKIHGHLLSEPQLSALGSRLGSDVPFFLQPWPAIARGRGENIQPLAAYPVLKSAWMVLIHPGFGISTPWAYQQLARFPEARDGRPGRAAALDLSLRSGDWHATRQNIYNSLEAPALSKHPLLKMFQDSLRKAGALATLMSGSGSATFALAESGLHAQQLCKAIQAKFGSAFWMTSLALHG